jgi:hypothetical protein
MRTAPRWWARLHITWFSEQHQAAEVSNAFFPRAGCERIGEAVANTVALPVIHYHDGELGRGQRLLRAEVAGDADKFAGSGVDGH